MVLSTNESHRAKALAHAAACATAFSDDSWTAQWIDLIADAAEEAVTDAAERDNLHDPSELANQPERLVDSMAQPSTAQAWTAVAELEAWRSVDWEAVLTFGWVGVPDDDNPGQSKQVSALVFPADPADLADTILLRLGERIARLAVDRAREQIEDEQDDEDTEDTE